MDHLNYILVLLIGLLCAVAAAVRSDQDGRPAGPASARFTDVLRTISRSRTR
jgi:hypothetical protein